MRARRVVATVLAVGAALTLAVGVAAGEPSPGRPRIAYDPAVPADLRAVADGAWTSFTDAFRSRWACIPDVHLTDAWRLPVRARYDPAERLVTVRVPGTAPNLRATIVHEFAHHLEFGCPAVSRLRPAFRTAQGLPDGVGWFRGASWDRVPSEQFAEATVVLVLGPSGRPRVLVRPAALAILRRWIGASP
jgi:hypothetical protein